MKTAEQAVIRAAREFAAAVRKAWVTNSNSAWHKRDQACDNLLSCVRILDESERKDQK